MISLAVTQNSREGASVTISVQGVVARGKGEPVELTTILVPEPGPGSGTRTVVSSTGSPLPRATTP